MFVIGIYETNKRGMGNEEMHFIWCEEKQCRGRKHVHVQMFRSQVDALRAFFDPTLFFTITPNDEHVFNFN